MAEVICPGKVHCPYLPSLRTPKKAQFYPIEALVNVKHLLLSALVSLYLLFIASGYKWMSLKEVY